jgi:polar amino acid transport system substrate-binding protein
VWNGMTITNEALLNAKVSDPYVQNKQVVVAKADKIDSIKTAADLKDLKVAVENGSAGQGAAESAEVKDIIAVQDQAAALLEVKAGTSDACIIDSTMASAMTGEGTDYAELAAGISLTDELYGVAFRKNSDLTDKFNAFMAKLIKDGTLKTLADKYNLVLAADAK